MKKIMVRKGYLAGVLAFLLVAVGIYLPSTYAANAIDVNTPCSLTLNVSDSGSYAADLKTAQINVNLYRVASVDETGRYTSNGAFASLKIEEIKAGEENWKETARLAADIVEADGQSVVADSTFQMNAGTGSSTANLQTGLYLVMVDKAQTELYEYEFSPYLISLPDNLYYQSGNATDDEWIYNAQGGLKPEQHPRYGSLRILKSLNSYNESLGQTTFVFQIEGVDENGESVYSNVVSTTHSSAGTVEAVIDQIPAGTVVTVTEVYSGASYELVSAPESNVTITADQVRDVTFTNTYNERLIPGYGVTNHFENDEDDGWVWTQQ